MDIMGICINLSHDHCIYPNVHRMLTAAGVLQEAS